MSWLSKPSTIRVFSVAMVPISTRLISILFWILDFISTGCFFGDSLDQASNVKFWFAPVSPPSPCWCLWTGLAGTPPSSPLVWARPLQKFVASLLAPAPAHLLICAAVSLFALALRIAALPLNARHGGVRFADGGSNEWGSRWI